MDELFRSLNRQLFYGLLPAAYRVVLVPRTSSLLEFGQCLGKCQWALRRILIAEHLSADERRKTLLHEMAHAATEGRDKADFHGVAWQAEMWRLAQLGERWAEAEATRRYGADFGCLTPAAALPPARAPITAATTIERRAAPAKPLDQALAIFTRLEETRSLCRRALRAQGERLILESRALRAAAERRLDAPDTPMGQLLAAARR